MFYHCDHCGFEKVYAKAPAPLCAVCGLGTMVAGQADTGFTVGRDGGLVVRGIARPQYRPKRQGTVAAPDSFNYFTGVVGKSYQAFIRQNTTFVGKFTNIMVPDPGRFAWLSPYTGNKHNRTHFTQLVIACVAQAKFKANGGKFPALIEPFVGSGQIFLHACTWGPALNEGVPLFCKVIAGDLNPYLIAAYQFILDYKDSAVPDYLGSATSMDSFAGQFGAVVTELNDHGRDRLANKYNVGELHEAAVMYIWLVNRCLHGSSLNATGVNATVNAKLDRAKVRRREGQAITAVLATLRGTSFSYACRDFAQTTALAQPSDIVVMDCPFPKFAYTVPTVVPDRPETFDSVTANTYGTGDDGAALQSRIVDEAKRLTDRGTTVILCNFANPGLVLAYRKLLTGIADADKRHFIYTYRSPSTKSEAYQLAILPGANVDFSGLPAIIRARWQAAGGDDGYNVNNQEYFDGQGMEVDYDEPSGPGDEDSGDEDYVDQ